ncbi:MAG TPA: hypothetical protein VFC78_04985 [Tepidisphaeraceae bacterium]|nr:hypothetical protein [Tepidisphaeraceae bacterium]
MNPPPPPLLPHPASRQSRRDGTYTVMLALLAFLSVCGIVAIWSLTARPGMNVQSVWTLHLVIATEACYLAFEVFILIIRWRFPSLRKWPTVTLNIALLPKIPLGTIIGIYGL